MAARAGLLLLIFACLLGLTTSIMGIGDAFFPVVDPLGTASALSGGWLAAVAVAISESQWWYPVLWRIGSAALFVAALRAIRSGKSRQTVVFFAVTLSFWLAALVLSDAYIVSHSLLPVLQRDGTATVIHAHWTWIALLDYSVPFATLALAYFVASPAARLMGLVAINAGPAESSESTSALNVEAP